jgi:phosphoserine phosphatase RsbU/P
LVHPLNVLPVTAEPDPSNGGTWASTRTIFLASAVLLATTMTIDLLVSPRVAVLTVFLGLAPLLASSALAAAPTAGFAAAAVAFAAVSGLWNHGGTQYWIRLADVALVGSLSVVVAAVRSRREADLRASRHIADVVQRALLPVLPEQIGPVRCATRYHSATRTAQVGGDFFDFVADGDRIRIILGDVSGKGVDAAAQAARVIRAFRQYAASERDLLTVARRVDEYVTPFWQWEHYATAVLLEVTDADHLTVVSAGHPAPLHESAGGVSDLAVHPCVPLGLGPATHATVHAWGGSDRLLLYTDGLVEARDKAGDYLPRTVIDAALGAPDAETCLDMLLDGVYAHAGQFDDDLALLLLTHTTGA